MRAVFLALIAAMAMAGGALAGGDVTVYAAASLTEALGEIEKTYGTETGKHVKFSFASSSVLAKQIEAGGQAGVFVSADGLWMDYVETRKLIAPGTRKALAGNSLVMVVPADKPLTLDLKAGGDWLSKLPEGKIATGDTAHVPAGIYAKEALTKLGAWDKAGPRIAGADNVRAALVLVERGEAAAGIVYATDAAISKGVVVAGTFPADSHRPIVYPAALTLSGADNPDARAFYDYLLGEKSAAILAHYGFSRPQ